ncbi:MAG TPA: prepilin-type N-terminal cleavage/methylation domain-containing protein [Trueperaceae bacterium]|nr:prepilin-type N-terminal cleavage/methylation domain-containing protein [Trueperaceae bacterium]
MSHHGTVRRSAFGHGAGTRGGLTLVEVMVALAVLTLGLLAWVRLDGALVRTERDSAVRRELAAWMREELRLQRNVHSFDCLGQAPGAGWSCSVERTCVAGPPPCEAESIGVAIVPPAGHALVGRTAVWWPLQRAEVAGAGP